MYLAHYGLKHRPFRDAPDVRFFFHSATHDAALAELLYAVDDSPCAALLSGPSGSGKTLVLRALLGGLAGSEEYRAGLLVNSMMGPAEVVYSAARALGVADLPESAAAVSESHAQARLEQRLAELASGGVRAVLAIDDAHAIASPAVWEALRQTLSTGAAQGASLALVLAGNDSLPARVGSADGFNERVGVRTSLAPLTPEESLDYLLHRLACAGASSGVFTRRAAETLARLSGGLPSRINHLADLAMAAAFGLGMRAIGPEIVAMAAEESSAARTPGAAG